MNTWSDNGSSSSVRKEEPYSARSGLSSELQGSEEDALERIEEEEAVGRLSVDEHNEVFRDAHYIVR